MKRKILVLMMAVCLLSSMKVEAKVISEEITNLSKTDSINFATDDADKNVRYIGVQPKNYVNFNNELWRIVGVFNGHVKLIRVEALGRYSYDSSESAINGGLGVNYWGDSDLMYELNGDYLNYNLTENAKWYDNQNNSKKGNFDYTKVIGKEAQELIEESTWYLGSPNVVDGELSSEKELFTASSLYYYERNGKNDPIEPGTSNSNDNVERKTTWTGKIGLLYPSDYLYSVGSSDTITRDKCLSSSQWRHELNDCSKNTWLVKSSTWLISPFTQTSDNRFAFEWLGAAEGNPAAFSAYVNPSLYLKNNVEIVSGDGSKENPYTLKLMVEDTSKGEVPEEVEVESTVEPKEEIKTKNPKTSDGVVASIAVLLLSVGSLCLVNKNKKK